jgi:single-stranded-DNA-specific exonuclease
VFQEIDNSYPDIIKEFGGHRGAAGVKIEAKNLDTFSKAVESIVRKKIVYDDLKPQIVTDGELSESEINKAVIDELNAIEPFGNKFESPVFEGLFQVKEIRVLGKEPIHLGLTVAMRTSRYKAIWFRALEKAGSKIEFNIEDTIRCAYKLKLNMFRGKCNLQLLIEHAQPAE